MAESSEGSQHQQGLSRGLSVLPVLLLPAKAVFRECSEGWDVGCSEGRDVGCSEGWDVRCSEGWDVGCSEG